MIIDSPPVRDHAGPSRWPDMLEGRSKQVFTSWLQAQTPRFSMGIEAVAMDGLPAPTATPTAEPRKPHSQRIINTISTGVPAALTELTTLGRTLKHRAPAVLAYFDRPARPNGPTEAINGRREHLRGTARGFRNLANHITGHYSIPADSDREYTLFCDEPQNS